MKTFGLSDEMIEKIENDAREEKRMETRYYSDETYYLDYGPEEDAEEDSDPIYK